MEQSTPNVISNQHSNLTSSFWRSALIDQNIENSTPIPDEESNKIVTEGERCNKDSTTKSRTLPSNTEVVGIKKIHHTHIMVQENATPPLERDALLEAIKSSGLPLRMRRTTPSIGNCWWIAVEEMSIYSRRNRRRPSTSLVIHKNVQTPVKKAKRNWKYYPPSPICPDLPIENQRL